MSSAFSSALAELDASLQSIQFQVDCLRAGLDVSDDQLSRSLATVCQHAATVRELVRAERPDVSWRDRAALDLLIHEIEVAAQESRNQQRRARLQELADELDGGRVRHRIETRSAALNALRVEAVRQLRAEAAHDPQEKDLPGPAAGEWLHWACSLQEGPDAVVLAELRRNFPALEAFTGEIEENYWVPSDRVREAAPKPPEPAVRVARPAAAESPAPRPPMPAKVISGENRVPQVLRAQPDTQTRSAGYAQAPSPARQRPSGETPRPPEIHRGSQRQAAAPAAARQPYSTQAAKYCESCGSHYPAEFNVCPIDSSVLRTASEPGTRPAIRESHRPPETSGDRARTNARPVPAAPVVRTPSPEPVVLKSAAQPVVPRSQESAADSAEELRAALLQRSGEDAPVETRFTALSEAGTTSSVFSSLWASAEDVSSRLAQVVSRKLHTLPTVPTVVACAALLLFAVAGGVMWRWHRSHTANAPVQAAENRVADQTQGNPQYDQPVMPTDPAKQTLSPNPMILQSGPPPQGLAARPAEDAPAKPAPEASIQVLQPPAEAPRTVAAVRKEEAPGDDSAEMPGPVPGAVPGGTANAVGNLVSNIPTAVPKIAGQKIRVSSGVAQAQLVQQVAPKYPPQARQARIQGTVVLQAVIGKDGRVQSVQVMSGPSMLTKAAADAVKQWRYKPFSLDGQPVEADAQINVNFKLPGE